MTMDLSDISHSSGGPLSDRRRRCRPLSSNKTHITEKRHVHFSSPIADDGPLAVGILEFANTEFCSQDVKVRKQIWYSSLEIRGIKQANVDACSRAVRDDNVDHDINNSNNNEDEDDDDAVCWRGLEHLVEGETKRRQRIQHFVCAILKLQTDRLRKGSKPEAISDALQSFARSQSRSDRRRAQKVGKLDSAEAQLWNDEQQLDEGNKNDNSTGKSKSFLLRGAASSRRILGLHARRRRISSMLPPSQQQQPQQQEPQQRSSLPIRRNLSGDHDSFQKRRTLLRRMSLRAAALFPNNNNNNSSSRRQPPSGLFLNASTHSLESTGSTASAATSSSKATVSVAIMG